MKTGAELPGIKRGRKLPKLGYRGIDTGEIGFVGAECDAALGLVGGEEGQGFYQATNGLEIGRVNVAARGVGIAKKALRESVSYAQQRQTMGKPIAEHQAIQLKLGEMATKTRASELLVEDAARAYDNGGRIDMEAGMAKYFATETAFEVATEAMRIFGANGYSKEYPIERLYRDAPLLIIGEGTNEMQRIIIARQLVKRNQI
jgi:alkylation response protein AidB-like acyl-CoA dehydrogenase